MQLACDAIPLPTEMIAVSPITFTEMKNVCLFFLSSLLSLFSLSLFSPFSFSFRFSFRFSLFPSLILNKTNSLPLKILSTLHFTPPEVCEIASHNSHTQSLS
jgi:hypothetical protein